MTDTAIAFRAKSRRAAGADIDLDLQRFLETTARYLLGPDAGLPLGRTAFCAGGVVSIASAVTATRNAA